MDSYGDFSPQAGPGAQPPAGAAVERRGVPRTGEAGCARACVGLGALAGLGAVGMAAMAAHALPARLPPPGMDAVRSAVQMQGWHALAVVACGLWAPRGGWLALGAGGLFLLGMALFCGAVYLWALAGVGGAGLAPVGGVLLMVGWAVLGASAIRRPPALPS